MCVNVVNSAGVRFEKACCHIVRRGFYDVRGVKEEVSEIGE